MYVPFETYRELALSEISKEEYAKVAPMADAIIDHWTLERVGRAVRDDEELPDIIVTLYCKIVDAIPDMLEGTKIGKGGLVSSFSNGIDSYTFDVSETMDQQLHNRFAWMLELLPVEWGSACVHYRGGNVR